MIERKGTLKKVLNVIFDVLVYAFVIVAALTIVFSVISKRDTDGAVNIFGMQMRIVISPSMEKCEETDVSAYKIKDIPVKSMVFIELVPEDSEAAKEWYAGLQVGDVLTFRYKYATQETITHRIISITQKPTGGYIISLEGDNKASDANTLKQTIDTDEAETSPNYVIGKVTGQSRVLGFLVYSVKQPMVMVLLVIVPCAVIIVLQVIKIISVLSADRKKRANEEKMRAEEDKKRQSDEIEELKKQLAALQQTNNDTAAAVAEERSEEEKSDGEKFEDKETDVKKE